MDEQAVNEVALGVFFEIDEHLRRNVDDTEVELEDLFEFVNTTDRTSLYRTLRDDPETREEVAAVLSSHSEISEDVFYKLREACGGIETIGTDPEKRAEVDTLLAKLGEITKREGPPSIDALSTTETAVDEPSFRIIASRMSKWLNSVEPQRFYSAWGSVPSLYEEELQRLTTISDESELVFGNGTMETITEELVNSGSVVPPSPTVRHWLNSITQTSSAVFYESNVDVPGSLVIFDRYVVAGYFAREDSPMGAFLVTDDAAFREWTLEVYQDWRDRSEELEMPMRFQGENPHLEDSNANDRQSDIHLS